jgi:adenosine deaminase CECR1
LETLSAKESIWEEWIAGALKNLSQDGIIHLELRGFYNTITIPNSLVPKYNNSQIILKWLQLIEDLNANLPPQLQMSMLFIYSVSRSISVDALYAYLLEALELMADPVVGPYVVGFDIVNEEDRYYSLEYYLPAWLAIKDYIQQHNLTQIKYFFHAGETAWNKRIAENLYDAILLNTTRIGHGYAIKHYPQVIKDAIQKSILIEVSPISNQMLRLLDDLRDHPAQVMMNFGIQISINSDDPTIYGNQGLSYDMWASFISWNLTLSSLKKLTFNSINYSALSDTAKNYKINQLVGLWNNWIQTMIPLTKEYSNR